MNLDLGDTRLILQECLKEGLTVSQAAYVLATGYHETFHTMKPVRETLAKTSASAVARLDNAFENGQLPWVKTRYWTPDADGHSWHGRGYVQLTWKDNYELAARLLKIPLLSNPDLALEPQISSRITVVGMRDGWFTGKKLSDYINETKDDSFREARRIVNGKDKAKLIEGYAFEYGRLLREDGYGLKPEVQLPLFSQSDELLRQIYDLLQNHFDPKG